MGAPLQRSISQITLSDRKTIAFSVGDITDEETDAIVNAANSALIPGAGVAGAIHRRGGETIYEECCEIVRRHGELPEGKAVITAGGNLPARHVIHTVGPVWRDGRQGEAEKLASCFRDSIALADRHGLRSIAFPAISTGVFRYPVDAAAAIAISEAATALRKAKSVNGVHFVLYDPATFAAFVAHAKKLASEDNLRFDTYTVP